MTKLSWNTVLPTFMPCPGVRWGPCFLCSQERHSGSALEVSTQVVDSFLPFTSFLLFLPPDHADRSLFLPSSSASPARIIILHLWHHHELQWGGWDVTNRGFCHKLGILAPEWAREKRNPKDRLWRQSFCLCKPQKTGQEAELLFKHTHTKETYESHYKDTVLIKTNGQKRDANKLMLGLCIS